MAKNYWVENDLCGEKWPHGLNSRYFPLLFKNEHFCCSKMKIFCKICKIPQNFWKSCKILQNNNHRIKSHQHESMGNHDGHIFICARIVSRPHDAPYCRDRLEARYPGHGNSPGTVMPPHPTPCSPVFLQPILKDLGQLSGRMKVLPLARVEILFDTSCIWKSKFQNIARQAIPSHHELRGHLIKPSFNDEV